MDRGARGQVQLIIKVKPSIHCQYQTELANSYSVSSYCEDSQEAELLLLHHCFAINALFKSYICVTVTPLFIFPSCDIFKGLQRAGGPGRVVNRRPAAQLGPGRAKMLGPRAGWRAGRAGPRAFLNKSKWLLNKGRKRGGGFEPLPSSLNFKTLTN